MRKVKIGTRASKLAQQQTLEVQSLLHSLVPNLKTEIVAITTSGDKIQDRNLAQIGGKGLFIKELEESLTQGKIDIAVHSAKDVPPTIHHQTEIAAFLKRLDARDCLVSEKFTSLQNLPLNAVVGTSSARRRAMLLKLRPDLQIVNFRGNVDSRLSKIKAREVDASILAVCGLQRLKKLKEVKEIIGINEMLPSGGQGALLIQVRKDDQEILQLVKKIDDLETRICLTAERAFLEELGASCSTPVGVYSHIENDLLHLKTTIIDYDGLEVFTTQSHSEANVEAASTIGIKAALKTKSEAVDLMGRIT